METHGELNTAPKASDTQASCEHATAHNLVPTYRQQNVRGEARLQRKITGHLKWDREEQERGVDGPNEHVGRAIIPDKTMRQDHIKMSQTHLSLGR